MSAADYNGDGLLDVYIATYRPEALGDGAGGQAKAAAMPRLQLGHAPGHGDLQLSCQGRRSRAEEAVQQLWAGGWGQG